MKRLLLSTLMLVGLMFAACSKQGQTEPDTLGTTMTSMLGCLEIPEIVATDDSYFYHSGNLNGKSVRNWSFYWDFDNRVSRWVAYPLYKSIHSGASDSDAWGYDPLLPASKQQNVTGGYKEGNNGWYNRGQLIPSSDRAGDDLNASTFYSTNMAPMDMDFQSGIMSNLERKIRSWADQSDTCYVISGCKCDGAKYYVLDRSNNKITVPTAFFKAVLRYSSNSTVGIDGFCAIAFFFDHEEYSQSGKSSLQISKNMSMSVSDLETILGYKLFVNLAYVIGEDKANSVKQENPKNINWWWL